jgi:hypothetical protein
MRIIQSEKWRPHVTVKPLQRLAEVTEVAVNAPEHVIERGVFIEAEIIEQPRWRSLKPIIAVSLAESR